MSLSIGPTINTSYNTTGTVTVSPLSNDHTETVVFSGAATARVVSVDASQIGIGGKLRLLCDVSGASAGTSVKVQNSNGTLLGSFSVDSLVIQPLLWIEGNGFGKLKVLSSSTAAGFNALIVGDGLAASPSVGIGGPTMGFYNYGSGITGFASSGTYSLGFGSGGTLWGAQGSNYITLAGTGNILIVPTANCYIRPADTYDLVVCDTTDASVLIGTASDGANGKLQLGNHTSITGGIGFGTGAAIYATSSGGAALETNASLVSKAATGGVGYSAGAGGTVTQSTSKVTAFTLSKVCGTITFAGDILNANTTSAGATWTNTAIAATDTIVCNHISGGTLGAYQFIFTPGAGSCTVKIRNITGGNLTEAPVIQFAVIKSVTS